MVRGLPPFADAASSGRIALVGETLADVREVMIEGPSGLLGDRAARAAALASRRGGGWCGRTARWRRCSRRRIPESLRGPQFDAAWCDELGEVEARRGDLGHAAVRAAARRAAAAAGHDDAAADAAAEAADRRCRRRGDAGADGATTRGNLAPGFLEAVTERYGGTRLGRQELDGELIEDRARRAVDARRCWRRRGVGAAPELRRIVVAVDPPATSAQGADACGIVAAGLDADGRRDVLADATRRAAPRRRTGRRRAVGAVPAARGRRARRRGQPGRRHGARR